MMRGDFGRLAANVAIAEEAEHAHFLAPENQLPKRAHGQRETAEALLPFFLDGKIHARDDPRRGTLKEVEFTCARSNLRDELDSACACADDGDALGIEIDGVIPGGGMEFWSCESFDSLQL